MADLAEGGQFRRLRFDERQQSTVDAGRQLFQSIERRLESVESRNSTSPDSAGRRHRSRSEDTAGLRGSNEDRRNIHTVGGADRPVQCDCECGVNYLLGGARIITGIYSINVM